MATGRGTGLLLLVFFSAFISSYGRYEPNWASLDTRPLPSWYDEVKFGIFMHWGVFSVPSFSSEWFWNSWHSGNKACVEFMEKNYPPDFTYADFGPMFKAEFYDPNEWADILKASGAKYVVLTSKHHEGYTMWPSKYSWNWNVGDVGPKRDLVGDLATAIRNRTNIHFGLYHSMFEWFHPLYLQDKANNFKTQVFPKVKALPELYEIVNRYKPEVIWSDGEWEAPSAYWNATSFLAWLYNDSPVKDIVVVNDRWGKETRCKDGGFYTCQDSYQPGHLVKHKWENCMPVDKSSWGYRRTATLGDLHTMEELVAILVETVSCGGNLLLNIGPTSDGRIVPVFEERLRGMGSWLNVNGEAIYGSKPWAFQKDNTTKNLWYTSKPAADGTMVYAIALEWPQTNVLSLSQPKPTASTKVSLLGYATPLKWRARPEGGIDIIIPNIPTEQMPCQWGWTFKLEGM